MTTQSIVNQIKLQNSKGLSKVYAGVCEEYRKRLCEQWGIDINESWWVADIVGGTLILFDLEYSFGMEDLRLFVDRSISYEDFCEWWNHCIDDVSYEINSYNWFVNGFRPKDLNNGKDS